MRERVALAGGELKIDSSPEGTAIAASIPLTSARGQAIDSAPVVSKYGGGDPDSEGLHRKVPCLGDDRDVGLPLEQQMKGAAHPWVPVGQDDADDLRLPRRETE